MIVKRIEENRPPEWIFCYPNTERSGFARYGSCGKIHGTERFCKVWLLWKDSRNKAVLQGMTPVERLCVV